MKDEHEALRSLGVGLGAFSLVVGCVATLALFAACLVRTRRSAKARRRNPLAMKERVATPPPQPTAPFAGLDLSRISVEMARRPRCRTNALPRSRSTRDCNARRSP